MAYKSQTVVVKITGVEQIRARLKTVIEGLQRQGLSKVLRDALQPSKQMVEAKAPRGKSARTHKGISHPGYLKGSFRVRSVPTRNPYLLEARLESTAYTALWVEYGHAIVKGRGRSRKVVGSASASPFMRPTFEQLKSTGPALVEAGIQKFLVKMGV